MKSSLTNREGKLLRYTVGKIEPVLPRDCINTIAWSDLPHTLLQSIMAFKKLEREGYVTRDRGVGGYLATEAGAEHLRMGNEAGLWDAQGVNKGFSSRRTSPQ